MCREQPGPRCAGSRERWNIKRKALRAGATPEEAQKIAEAAHPLVTKTRKQATPETVAAKALDATVHADATSPNMNHRRLLAMNPDTDAATMEHMAANEQDLSVLWHVAKHPALSAETITTLASHENSAVRSCAAQNPNASADVLSKLSKDRVKRVKQEVAQNPNTPVEALRHLAAAADRDVAREAQFTLNRHHPDAPAVEASPSRVETRNAKKQAANEARKAVASGDAKVTVDNVLLLDDKRQGEALRDPNTAPEVIDALAKSNSRTIRQMVAISPRITEKAATHLLRSKDATIREEVALNDHTPAASLATAAKHPDAYTRQLVAEHDNTPTDALLVLATDGDDDVRDAVKARTDLDSHPGVLETLGN